MSKTNPPQTVLVSACLLGEKCRWDGGDNRSDALLELLAAYTLIPLCPEKEAGLGVPRQPIEIRGGEMVRRDGKRVTEEIRRGIARCLQGIDASTVKAAILKDRSPTCGCGQVHDGSFSGKLVAGDGWFTSKLKSLGVACFSAEEVVKEPTLMEKSRNVEPRTASNDGMRGGKPISKR